MASNPNRFTGVFLDGRTPKKFPVELEPQHNGLCLLEANVLKETWPYAGIRVEGVDLHGPFRLERSVQSASGERVESIVVEDRRLLDRLHEMAPHENQFFWSSSQSKGKRRTLLVGGVLLSLLLIFFGWTQGLPALTSSLAEHVPPEWEAEVGNEALSAFPENQFRTLDKEQSWALDQIMQRLLQGYGTTPYTFHLYVMNNPGVNALAFPGGHILILQGLLDLTETPEELAGVLAHEIQHVVQRHATQSIIRQTASSWMLKLITGGTDNALDFILSTANTLGHFAFSREMEMEADLKGMDLMLAAHIDPQAMVSIFRKLHEHSTRINPGEVPNARKTQPPAETPEESKDKDSIDFSGWLGYVSTHPAGEDRIRSLQQRMGSAPAKARPLLPGFDWTRMYSKKKKEGKSA